MSFTPLGPPHFLYVSAGESRLMLLHTLVAMPSVLALVVGLSSRLSAALEVRLDRWAGSDSKEFRTAAVAFTLILFALYRIGRVLVLQDLPVTDDENGIDFGARMLASGRFSVAELSPEGAYYDLFVHRADGRVSSFDWPGGVLFRAASLASGLRDHLYALMAAIAGTAVVASAHRLLGPRAGLLAGLVFIASPLALGLSMTTHAHVVSRAFIAVAIWVYVEIALAEGEGAKWRPVALGLAAGAAFMTRPFESMALLGPLAVHLLWGAAVGREGMRRVAAGAAAGFVVMLIVFAVYNTQITGTPWLPPRFDRAHVTANAMPAFSIDDRISLHVSHNVMLLAVYMLGVLGLPVALIGALGGRHPLPVLGLGIAAALALMLGHDNVGIHTIGPIHYTDAAVPLTLLFVAGVDRITAALPGVAAHIRAAAFGYVILGVGVTFTLPWLGQLSRHGEFVARPYDLLAASKVSNAIVITPQLAAMRRLDDPGSWQLDMPHPDPLFEEDIIFARADADPDALHQAHPTRNIYRLTVDPETRDLDLAQLHEARAPSSRRE
jgi:hypothetical protein